MKVRDYHYLIVMTLLVGVATFVFSGSGNFMEEMIGLAVIIGGIILLSRRLILRAKRKLEEKKQAV